MLRKLFKEEKGFTMIELIIVIAIIAIIGAIIAPNFTKATTKATVKADIASIKEVNRQIALYVAEKGKYPGTASETIKHGATSGTANGGFKTLHDEKYLEALPVPQTQGLTFVYDKDTGKAYISKDSSPAPSQEVLDMLKSLSGEDQKVVDSSLTGTSGGSGSDD